ncbi:hypothetical protein ALQ33_200017 [Pseudomonas syringae pv. philadelphi]|uniref:Uncharacterized protein n=1 Tax=Pseudomonas syringae pv. philadelphi TaxID=251706 RepID=A0A3M3YJ52_9PSED|nr:hypothetical protein [Pseudomonas syringae group genomosp. 3]RMO82527.1 hypothetical protein ALQ33_200017 [Pseudomonas syringae pv. philadelphi]
MTAAMFGLLGVLLGGFITVIKEVVFRRNKSQKDLLYLSIIVSTELERFVSQCIDAVNDDGLYHGQRNTQGCLEVQTASPGFVIDGMQVDWQTLPANLLYEVLDLPYQIEKAQQIISSTFEYVATPPDYDEGFWERSYQYSILGLKAADLVVRLRIHSRVPQRETSGWTPLDAMRENIEKYERYRDSRT